MEEYKTPCIALKGLKLQILAYSRGVDLILKLVWGPYEAYEFAL